jgi:hypothetical protein
MKKVFAIVMVMSVCILIHCVTPVPNYVLQTNEGKIYKDEDLVKNWKLNIKIEGADRFTIKKLLSDPECLSGNVLSLLLGQDPFLAQIDKIIQSPQKIDEVRRAYQKAIECAEEYLRKITEEKEKLPTQNSENAQTQQKYETFKNVNKELYTCTYKVMRCMACRQDCGRYGILDPQGNLSKIGLQRSVTCYDHCLSAIPPANPSRLGSLMSDFCEKCLDNYFVTDKELCDEECDFNPMNKCATMTGDMQDCIKKCKEKYKREEQFLDYEECIGKCEKDITQKYSKEIARLGDEALSLCILFPLTLENAANGKFVDYAKLVGVCLSTVNSPGFQTQGPCGVGAAQPATAGSGQQGQQPPSSGQGSSGQGQPPGQGGNQPPGQGQPPAGGGNQPPPSPGGGNQPPTPPSS